MNVISFLFGNLIHVIFSWVSNVNNELTILEYLRFLVVIWGCGLIMGMVGNSVFFFLKKKNHLSRAKHRKIFFEAFSKMQTNTGKTKHFPVNHLHLQTFYGGECFTSKQTEPESNVLPSLLTTRFVHVWRLLYYDLPKSMLLALACLEFPHTIIKARNFLFYQAWLDHFTFVYKPLLHTTTLIYYWKSTF